jgi:hypothetical protein
MTGFLTNGGQICTAHTRLIVHKRVAAKLLGSLKEAVEALPFLDNPVSERSLGDRAWVDGRSVCFFSHVGVCVAWFRLCSCRKASVVYRAAHAILVLPIFARTSVFEWF